MNKQVIDRFDGKYFFLSNFYEAPVEYMGYEFQSNEAAFQGAKCPSRIEEFIGLPPNKAKRLGRKVELRQDWEAVKDSVMYEICLNKFTRYTDLKDKLLATGEAELIEGNYWHDYYWGVCEGKGLNKLGNILMKIRSELKKR